MTLQSTHSQLWDSLWWLWCWGSYFIPTTVLIIGVHRCLSWVRDRELFMNCSPGDRSWRGQLMSSMCFPNLDLSSDLQGKRLGTEAMWLILQARLWNTKALFLSLVITSALDYFQNCNASATSQEAFPNPPARTRLLLLWLLSELCISYSTYENCFCIIVICTSSCLIHSRYTFKICRMPTCYYRQPIFG